MRTRYFALIIGIVYLLVGILGFVPALLGPPGGPPLAVEAGYGRLFGLFPVNLIHNLVHIAAGIWGIAAWRTFTNARAFARGFAVIFLVLGVFGFIPGLATLFGLTPLFGHDVWLHLLSGAVAAYFGWASVPATARVGAEHHPER